MRQVAPGHRLLLIPFRLPLHEAHAEMLGEQKAKINPQLRTTTLLNRITSHNATIVTNPVGERIGDDALI